MATAAPGIKLATDRAEISGNVANSFAVWLQFRSSVDFLSAIRTGDPTPTGAWYLPPYLDRVVPRSAHGHTDDPDRAGLTPAWNPGEPAAE